MNTAENTNAPRVSVDAEVGALVHQLMWEKKITQTALGRAIGADQSTVGRKLRGERKWTLDEMRTVATELGTSVGYLLGETSDPTPPDDIAGWAPSGSNRRPTDYRDVGSDELFPEVADLDLARTRLRPITVEVSA